MREVEHTGSIVHIDTMFYLPKKIRNTKNIDSKRVTELRPGSRIDTIDNGVKHVEEVFCVGEQIFIEYEFKFPDPDCLPIKVYLAHGCHINFRRDGLQAPMNTKLWTPKRIFSAYAYQIRFKERQCVFRDTTGLGYLSFIRNGDILHDHKKVAIQKRNHGSYYRDRTRPRGESVRETVEEGRGD